jgi:hypothetical protein
MPGGFMAVSANGNRDGIVWVNHPYRGGDDNGDGALGALSAIDATSMQTLWDSRNRPNNAAGTFAKFSPPIIADGKVFVNAFDPFDNSRNGTHATGAVVVYGMQCSPACPSNRICIDGQCQPCTSDDIQRTCNGQCGIPNGCGGTCTCPSGMTCGSLDIEARPDLRNGPPIPPPGGGGGGSSHRCECTPRTIQRNCAGRCSVPNGCGGTCGCADGQSCNPTTQTCCDWQAQCAKAGACATVCGDEVKCPCSDGYCDANNRCCSPRCTANTQCGAADGCGGACFGKCGPNEICVADGDGRSCELITIPCRRNPRFCDANPDELIAKCNKNPWACYVNTGRKHHQHHGSSMPRHDAPAH